MIAYKNPVSAYWWTVILDHPLPVLVVLISAAMLALAFVLWPGKRRQ